MIKGSREKLVYCGQNTISVATWIVVQKLDYFFLRWSHKSWTLCWTDFINANIKSLNIKHCSKSGLFVLSFDESQFLLKALCAPSITKSHKTRGIWGKYLLNFQSIRLQVNSSHEPCLILNDFDSFSFNRNLVYATDQSKSI